MHLTSPPCQGRNYRKKPIVRMMFLGILMIECMYVPVAQAQKVTMQPMIISETLAPGESCRTKLTINNQREMSVVAKVIVVGMAQNKQTGQWVMLDKPMPDSTKTNLEFGKACEHWISLMKQSTHEAKIEAKESSTLEVGIEVPTDADGTYWAALKVSLPPDNPNRVRAVRYDFVVPVLLEVKAKVSKEMGTLNANTILERWEATYGQIISLKTEYTETIHDLETGVVPVQKFFKRIQDGRHEYVRCTALTADGQPDRVYQEWSFDGKVFTRYTSFPSQGTIMQGPVDYKIWNPVTAAMFVNRNYRDDQFPKGVSSFSYVIKNALKYGKVHVRPEQETILGEPCHVLETEKNDGQKRRFWLAHNKNFLIMKDQWFRGDKMIHSTEVKALANAVSDTGIFWYPRELISEGYLDRKSKTSFKLHIFVPHIKVSSDTFAFQFPTGTTVIDRMADTHYIMGENQPKTKE